MLNMLRTSRYPRGLLNFWDASLRVRRQFEGVLLDVGLPAVFEGETRLEPESAHRRVLRPDKLKFSEAVRYTENRTIHGHILKIMSTVCLGFSTQVSV